MPRSAVLFPRASPNNAMTHIAMQEALDGVYSNWMEHVTDEQYNAKVG